MIAQILIADDAQAFALAEKRRPQLIILDIVMPGLCGSTALKLIQEYPDTAKIPIIIVRELLPQDGSIS